MLAHLLMTHFPNWSFSLWMWNRMWRKHKEEIENCEAL